MVPQTRINRTEEDAGPFHNRRVVLPVSYYRGLGFIEDVWVKTTPFSLQRGSLTGIEDPQPPSFVAATVPPPLPPLYQLP
ncbi:hypothetical protein TanjilG_14288 [Lupinus angustifolius]|uniref:Uncharacterized protein n=1 Tax=Lupinus angustifolius TaxID=3871 RepID=A0A1J7GI48_LUPAN|nr:hypothetical protein TanjilG_14288 [Lupinus angustifolius]